VRPGTRLGVDLGGTSVKLALVDARGRVLEQEKVGTPESPRALVAALKQAVRPWRSRRLLGTGVGVAGDVDPVRGVVRFAPNLKWSDVPLKKMFRAADFPGPLYFENDATAAAWGAYHAELKGRSRDLLVMTLGTGVGGGLVLGGKVHRGVTGSAGELGHMVIDPSGPRCGCGNSGCLETFLGGVHMVKWARNELRRSGRRVPPGLSPGMLYQMARRGDVLALRLWRRAGWALGLALSNLINVFNPDTVLLCGGVAGAAPLLLKHARPELTRSRFVTARNAARIRVSTDNQNLGVVGAALLVE
jgi:glucokinase